MKTSSNYYTIFTCDIEDCAERYQSPSEPMPAKRQARKLGWVRRRKIDLCPAHKLEDDARLKQLREDRAKAKADRRRFITGELSKAALELAARVGGVNAAALAKAVVVGKKAAASTLRGLVRDGRLQRGGAWLRVAC